MQIEETITISKQEYDSLKQENALMKSQIALLFDQVETLTTAHSLLRNGRKSTTSSTPASQDFQRSNSKSLRKKSGRNPGGQRGHDGHTLKMTATPDEVVEHRPFFCKDCGSGLESASFLLTCRRQEVVLPPITPRYVEHRSYRCTCSNCGTGNEGLLPGHLKGNIQYHPNVAALVGYLSVRQYVPYSRVAEMMKDVFHIPLSEGTVDNMLAGLAAQATPMYEEIQNRLEDAAVVGGDETGVRVNGKKGWLFAFQNQLLTFLSVSSSRGFSSIEHLFEKGFPKAVYVSDCLAAQLKTPARLHQVCLAHLQRELNNFIDVFDCKWSAALKLLFKQAIILKEEMTTSDYENGNEQVKQLETKLSLLLEENMEGCPAKIQAFVKRLKKNRQAILTFLYHPEVPPDNNGSERAIRNAKVKTKVSGQFKIMDGAKRFAILRSIIDTAIKNRQNPINALSIIAKYPAE